MSRVLSRRRGVLLIAGVCAALVLGAYPRSVRGDHPVWAPATPYAVGDRVTFDGDTYECVQAHTSQVGWEPPSAPALWVPGLGDGEGGEPVVIFVPAPIPDVDELEGWKAAPFQPDTATTGRWEQAVPEKTEVGDVVLQRDDAVNQGGNAPVALVTGPLAGASPGAHDVDGGVTAILSPDFCLSARAVRAELSLRYYFAHLANASPADFLRISVVVDEQKVATLLEVRGSRTNVAAEWQELRSDLTPFAGQPINLLVEAGDLDEPSLVEAAVDDIVLEVAQGPPTLQGVFAPYLDVTAAPGFPLADPDPAKSGGVTFYTLASMLDDNVGNCVPAWGGSVRLDQKLLLEEVRSLRRRGGDVIVSFGGAGFTDLAWVCPTSVDLTKRYQAVIDAYGLSEIDFAVPATMLHDRATNDRRSEAIANLRGGGCEGLRVSFTLPALPTGLTPEGLDLLRNAVENGVEVAVVNLAAMDYGNGAADPSRMGQNAVDAARNALVQLASVFPDRSADELRLTLGVTPMIGRNHVSPEVFTLDDARLLLDFARSNQIGRLSMWSLNRDRQCAGGSSVTSSCSGVSQAPFAFAGIFSPFAPVPGP